MINLLKKINKLNMKHSLYPKMYSQIDKIKKDHMCKRKYILTNKKTIPIEVMKNNIIIILIGKRTHLILLLMDLRLWQIRYLIHSQIIMI